VTTTIQEDIESTLRRFGALTTSELADMLPERGRASVLAQVHKGILSGALARRLRADFRTHGHLVHVAERAHELEWYGDYTDDLEAQAEAPPEASAPRGVDLRLLV